MLSMFVAIGVVIWVFEEFIPRPLPWMKFGFANIVTMIVLYRYGLKAAFSVGIIRIMLASILIGKFLSPPTYLSLGGFIMALTGIAITYLVFRRQVSMIGLSITGAFFHNIGQLAMAYLIIVQKLEVFYLLPYFALASIVTGGIIGIISTLISKALFISGDTAVLSPE
ncbi:Gx transporter family protein [bacterium]|nr:Gx transporter family protein [bacterium]